MWAVSVRSYRIAQKIFFSCCCFRGADFRRGSLKQRHEKLFQGGFHRGALRHAPMGALCIVHFFQEMRKKILTLRKKCAIFFISYFWGFCNEK